MGKAKAKSKAQRDADEIEQRLTTPVPRVTPIPDDAWLSSGLTLLNLAATGHPDRFMPKGRYMSLVGDSDSGKTWLSFNLFAEAARNPAFAKHRFIFDNAERGALMDVQRYFGAAVAQRVEPPAYDGNEPVYSETVQQFFYHIDAALDAGPCIYILDSVDAIGADEDDDKFEEDKKAYEKGKDVKGSYGMAKPKYISKHINRVSQRLDATESIGLFVSQTRDKVGGMIPGQRTRSGGRALKFFGRLEPWTSVFGPIRKTVLDKDRKVGSYILFDMVKNHLTGWTGKCPLIPFYRSHGFDDLGACVDFLIDEKHWHKPEKGGKIDAEEFDFSGSRDKLIEHIQDTNGEKSLRALVACKWREIEQGCAVNRKPNYV